MGRRSAMSVRLGGRRALLIAGLVLLAGMVLPVEADEPVAGVGADRCGSPGTTSAVGRLPLWLAGPGAVTAPWERAVAASLPEWPGLGQAGAGAGGGGGNSGRDGSSRVVREAVVTALMSAVIPGAGQIRNGSILRGFGYFFIEVGGWVAYSAFRGGEEDKTAELGRTSAYWDYERYHERAPYLDSCQVYECPCGYWSLDRDEEIAGVIERGDESRFYEYITRDAYACGWDSPLSRRIYRGFWSDREDLRQAKSWSGRLIFLNHLVSAVDAFLEARKIRLQLDESTRVDFRMRGLPFRVRPEVRITRHFG